MTMDVYAAPLENLQILLVQHQWITVKIVRLGFMQIPWAKQPVYGANQENLVWMAQAVAPIALQGHITIALIQNVYYAIKENGLVQSVPLMKAHVSIVLLESLIKCMVARMNVQIVVLVGIMETLAPKPFKIAECV